MTIIVDGTNGITSSGNLTLNGATPRVLGDFSNTTVANRVAFQTSTTNSNTLVGAIPNGTATQSNWNAFNNSDPTNASIAQLICTSTEASLRSFVSGTGTYLPLTFHNNGSQKMQLSVAGNLGIGVTPSDNAVLELKAGTNTLAPLEFTAGTNLTTASAGAVEYDGTCFYASQAASTRGVISTEQWIVLTGTNTLTSQTGVQPIFDGGGGPVNGQVTLQTGTYEFECSFALSGMSATSSSFGFALGGGATFTQGWQAMAAKGTATALTTPNAMTISWNTTANTAITAAGTGTVGEAIIKGIIRVTIGGAVIPQVSLGVAAAAVVQANSYFKIKPIGVPGQVFVGNWS